MGYEPDTLKPGEPLYMVEGNPHMILEPLWDGTGAYQCVNCGQRIEREDIDSSQCPVPSKPCSWCGQAPICAWDCKGIWAIIADPNIHTTGTGGEPE